MHFHEIYEQGFHKLALNSRLDLGLNDDVSWNFSEVPRPCFILIFGLCQGGRIQLSLTRALELRIEAIALTAG